MHFWKDGSWSGVCGRKPIVGPDEPETPSTAQELRPTGSPFGAIDASRTPTRRRTGGGGVPGSQARAQWPGPERVPRDLALRGVPTPPHAGLLSHIPNPFPPEIPAVSFLLSFSLLSWSLLALCFISGGSFCSSDSVPGLPVCPSPGQAAPRFQDDGDPQLLGRVEGLPHWLRDLLKALQPREGHGHTAGGPSRPCAGDRTPVMGTSGRIWAGPETGRPCGHLTGVT